MTLMSVVAQGTTEQGSVLPMSAAAFAVVAMIVFIALLGLTWTFRNTSNKRH